MFFGDVGEFMDVVAICGFGECFCNVFRLPACGSGNDERNG